MRIIEIFLCALCIASILMRITNNRQTKKINFISYIILIVFLVHLTFEGYRWQMICLYSFVTLNTLSLFFRNKSKVHSPIKKWIKSISGLFLIFSSIILGYYFPIFMLPQPTGKYDVGTFMLQINDNSRIETFSDSKLMRKLIIQIWYPADITDKFIKSPLMIDENLMIGEFLDEYVRNKSLSFFFSDYFKYIKSNSYYGADIIDTKGKFPLILISHGLGTSRILHTSQAENLASHGYVVVCPDHTFGTAATKFPDGEIARFKMPIRYTNGWRDMNNSLNEYGKIWTEDLKFIIDEMFSFDPEKEGKHIKNRIDLSKIGVVGHSLGGGAAYEISHRDDRITAGVDMDGSLFNTHKKNTLKKPFLFILSGINVESKKAQKHLSMNEKQLKAYGVSKEEYEEYIESETSEIFLMEESITNSGIILEIKETGHYNFTDLQAYAPNIIETLGLTGKTDISKNMKLLNHILLDFFNTHLKFENGNIEKIIDENPQLKMHIQF